MFFLETIHKVVHLKFLSFRQHVRKGSIFPLWIISALFVFNLSIVGAGSANDSQNISKADSASITNNKQVEVKEREVSIYVAPENTQTSQNTTQDVNAQATQVQQQTQMVPEIPDMVLGSPQASVVLIEYSSINCPHCAHYHNGPFKEFRKKYIDTGQVRYIMRHFPLDYSAVEYMSVIAFQPQEKWFPLVETSYAHLMDWVTQGPEKLVEILGLDPQVLAQARGDAQLRDQIMAKRFNAEQVYEIDATPAYVIEVRSPNGTVEKSEFINQAISPSDLETKVIAYIK